MRESWTDERLDYLNRKVDDGFKQVDKRLDRLESRMEQINDRMLELHRLIVQGGIAMFGTMFIGFMTVLATTL